MESVNIVLGVESGEKDIVLGVFEGTPEGMSEAVTLVHGYQESKFHSEDYYKIETFNVPFVRPKNYKEDSVIYDEDGWST